MDATELNGRVVADRGMGAGLGQRETRGMVTDAGGWAELVGLDVTDDDSRRRVVQDLFDRHGDAFDVLINVAGIDPAGAEPGVRADHRGSSPTSPAESPMRQRHP